MPLVNHSIMLKKGQYSCEDICNIKIHENFRFYRHREDGAKKVRSSSSSTC